MRLRWPTRSRRWANAPPKYPGHNATVFVILAVTAGSPAATSAGNEIRLPPPAMALTSPAASPVPAISVTDATSKLCIEPYLLDVCLPSAELFLDRFQSVNANAQRPVGEKSGAYGARTRSNSPLTEVNRIFASCNNAQNRATCVS